MLVVGESLVVAGGQLDGVDVVDVDAADADLAAVLDRPHEAFAQLDGLHAGAERSREQPFDGAFDAPLEITQKRHRRY